MKTMTKKKTTSDPSESMTNDATRVLDEATWPVGSVAYQGDLIFVHIAELPADSEPRAVRQLADGTTQGSRHICDKGDVFTSSAGAVVAAIKAVCPRSTVEAKYIGPVFRTKRGKALVTHPEHGWYDFRGSMTIAVIVQRNLDAEKREQRTQD